MKGNQGLWCTAIEKFTLANPLKISLLFSAHGNMVELADSSNKYSEGA